APRARRRPRAAPDARPRCGRSPRRATRLSAAPRSSRLVVPIAGRRSVRDAYELRAGMYGSSRIASRADGRRAQAGRGARHAVRSAGVAEPRPAGEVVRDGRELRVGVPEGYGPDTLRAAAAAAAR